MTTMKFRILILSCLLLPIVCAAEESRYAFRQLSVDNGLSQNSVLAIIQDRTGFMWFGTKDGLNRYDGSEIRRIAAEDAIPGNNYITALCEDGDGNIWIGTDAGVCVYDPETERARRFFLAGEDGCTITGNIPQIACAPDGGVWIVADDDGFFRYDPAGKTLRHVAASADGTLAYRPCYICFDSRGTAYFALEDGNIYRSDDSLATAEPLLDEESVGLFRSQAVTRMVAAPMNRIFVCTLKGLFEVSPAMHRIRRIELPNSNGYVRDIITVRNDEIWVASESCLEILDGRLQERAVLYADTEDSYALQDHAIYCLYRDRDGDMWVGTYFAGVHYCRTKDYTPFRRYLSEPQGDILGGVVREIVADSDGRLWIGTESKGLFRFCPRTGLIESVTGSDNLYADGLYSNIHGICCDEEYVWVGTYEGARSLVRIRRDDMSMKNYPSAGREIYSICRTAAGELLLGTSSGLKRYDAAADRFVVDTVIRSHIHQLREDSAGNVWAATYRDGLYRRDGGSGIWQHYLFDERDTTSLAADKVLSIFEDRSGRVWFTTQSGGICRYIPGDDSFVRYRDKLPFETFYRIEEDDDGVFWITSNNGLVRFDPATENYFVFTTDDGLLSNQFNYSSSCRSADGRIYFGCIKGFISFDPKELKPSDNVFPIVATSLRLYDREVGVGQGSPLTRSITLSDGIELAPDENSFSIKVATLNYQTPHQSNMRYRLEEFDSDWHKVYNNTISYSNLPYGSYRLVVQGIGSDGNPTGSELALALRLRPPFYLTLTAKLFYALCSLALLIAARIYFLRRMRYKQEKVEHEKERELYVAKFDFFTNIAHEIRTPLSLIKGPLDSMKNKLRDSDDGELHEDMYTMEQNTERLMTLINQLLDFRKAEKGGFKLHPAECDIRMVVRTVYERFSPTARQRKLDLSVDFPSEALFASVDREALTKIVSNLLSNAVKYAACSVRMELRHDKEQGVFRIILTNDGQIVPLDQRERIFQPFIQYRDSKHVIGGTGIGLTLARALSELHGGTLMMDSSTEVNRFILTIPIVHHDAAETSPATDPAPVLDVRSVEDSGAGKPSLLIVEDDPDMSSFIVRHMAASYDTVTAENGRAALDILAKNKPFDLILSDVMMPEMDGFELCQRIKSDLQYSHIPVLLLTAKTDMASKIEGLGIGADAYIEKPFSLEYLQASITTLLSNRDRIRRHFLESPFVKSQTLTHSKADEEFIDKLDAYIEQHLGEVDFSIDDIADEMCMSSSKLLRKLKGIVGKTPNEYLRIKRLKLSAELLQQNKYTIADISLRVGFGSPTYFSSCFKKQFGISPTEFFERRGDIA